MKNKKFVLAVAVVAVAAISFLGVTAQASHNGEGETLANRIATHFDLDKKEVQGIFDEYKTEMKDRKGSKMMGNFTDSTLTEEQQTALKEKYAELKEQKKALKDQNLTKEEMITEMKTIHAELITWAEENGIDLKSIKSGKKGAWMKKGAHSWKK